MDAPAGGQSGLAVLAPRFGHERQEIEAARPESMDFRTLYDAQVAFVWRSLLRLGALTADLEDLAHDVFLVAWRRLREYDATRPIRPWLFGIAMRVLANHRRAVGRRREVAVEVPREPRVTDIGRRHEARDLVLCGLAALDVDQRAVLCLHDVEGATMPEVAAALEIPLNTGYSRLRLARARFAHAIECLQAGQAPSAKESTDEQG